MRLLEEALVEAADILFGEGEALECNGDVLLAELGQAVISSHSIGSAPLTGALAGDKSKPKLKRLSLLLGSNGNALNGKTVERLARTWEKMLAAQSDADRDKRTMMRFLTGGVVGMLHGKRAGRHSTI